jgi:hypothetical protein
MTLFAYPIEYTEEDASLVRGTLKLDDAFEYRLNTHGSGYYRPGKIILEGGAELDLALYHNDATARFMYLRDGRIDADLLQLVGLGAEEIAKIKALRLPGQLCLGAERAMLIGRAIRGVLGAPNLRQAIARQRQENIAIFPIAREGLKYQVAEALFENHGFYCDEIILDAHHVFDQTVPMYSRKVEMTLFKDKDLDQQQHENITTAFIADSIASGLVMREVIEQVYRRFHHIQQVEVISPFATIRGLCRIARRETMRHIPVRVHSFETLLNALPPDYYYSAHINLPELHIRPDLEQEYRAWWGRDSQGNWIADTACAGYGWSEVFFSPRKQIEMINAELGARHGLTIADIVRRNIAAVS